MAPCTWTFGRLHLAPASASSHASPAVRELTIGQMQHSISWMVCVWVTGGGGGGEGEQVGGSWWRLCSGRRCWEAAGRPFVITQESAVTGQPLSRGGLSVTVRTFLPKVLKPPVESWFKFVRGAAGAVCRGLLRAGEGAGRASRGCSHEIVLTNCQDVTDGQVVRRRAPPHAAVSRQVPLRCHPEALASASVLVEKCSRPWVWEWCSLYL